MAKIMATLPNSRKNAKRLSALGACTGSKWGCDNYQPPKNLRKERRKRFGNASWLDGCGGWSWSGGV